ncbi:phenylalanine-tRNA ligase [Aphanomyces invadans]|uniref:phenylalanine--tRNA ligase n=1 Tax=Aphanomyces invadans TaxID=157072 RepID=A0A024TS89_9STRA|nr:phenylalanine-tRNA ligase [Aphanomyces invadans]ETV96222.1 phenylalanine-tRNA ligase [Aphanomyces invadans]|eukprot:XP_008875014.1 phenylalanine-tRNA ligase [Aphanomyces invadans]
MLHRALSAAPRTRPLLHAAFSTASSRFPDLITGDPYNNVSEAIASKVGMNLHRQPNHPLNIIKTKIATYFDDLHANGQPKMHLFDNLSPVVSVADCFDHMLIPEDHVSRRPTDTYYLNPTTLLRTHTSCHEVPLMKQGIKNFLVAGDVYRRDEIDASHYPVFHQMEGLRFFPELSRSIPYDARVALVQEHLKTTLEGMVESIFGKVEMRWVDAYFPFTDPSLELEIYFEGEWLEVLGCGVLQRQIAEHGGVVDEVGWAFGLGLERLAMVLFDIPDIRLFWTTDARFLSQFQDGVISKFKPYSKYPPCYKDVSFWLPPEFHENNLFEVVRNVAGDMVEQVVLVDAFTHPKTQRSSKCFRITYRHLDRNLTNEEVDDIQVVVRDAMVKELGVELR